MPRSRFPLARPIVALIGCSIVIPAALAACRSDGRTLRPADPSQNQSVYTPTTTVPPATSIDAADGSKVDPFPTTTITGVAQQALTLQLPFVEGGQIDARYTCNGPGVHPQISWSGVPDGTVEMALVVLDPDAGEFVHWVIAGLDPTESVIGEGDVPVGAIEGVDGAGTTGWTAPCPPAGTTHHYVFTLYALSQQVDLPTGSPATALLDVIQSSAIATAEVTGIYTSVASGSTTSTPASVASSTTLG